MESSSSTSPPPSPPPLEFMVQFCTNAELSRVTLLDKEHARVCEGEWRQRVLARFGAPRFRTLAWRKCFKLRAHLARKVVDTVSARVYLMNGRGETHFFAIPSAKSLMCSRERAVVYNRCERMFDLSLRINRSIQEISALIGMVSVDEARGLLNEHINLMASVASLRGSLLFESELFQVFPAPVLLDANALLRGTFAFPSADFVEGTSTLMMQVWASIDGLIYRPLAPPTVLEPSSLLRDAEEETAAAGEVLVVDQGAEADARFEEDAADLGEEEHEDDDNQMPEAIQPRTRAASGVKDYNAVKLHDLSGMTINIDDNTLRYKLDAREICVNALVSNTYLLYLFNPLNFRPLDWTFNAVVHVNHVKYELPVQREGVFLNTTSYALRVFLSYGKIPEGDSSSHDGASSSSSSRPRGGEDSAPLSIPYGDTTSDDHQVLVCFRLTATNRISKETREIASKTSSLSTKSNCSSDDDESCEPSGGARVTPVAPVGGVEAAQVAASSHAEDESVLKQPTARPMTTASSSSLESTERHVHLPFDAMICYSFSPHSLQYVEFAIGFEPLMHQLGVSTFLPEPPAAPVPVSA
ncbi:hypothetical protein Gpo141_00005558 [Globisporangium polare]